MQNDPTQQACDDALPSRSDAAVKFPPIPANFNPLTAPPQQLAHYGLPPRPNPKAQPALSAAWTRAFSQPLRFVERIKPFAVDTASTPQVTQARFQSTRFEDSENWSGAYIEPNAGNMFVLLFGEWTVPTPALPAGDPHNPPVAVTYNCSNWIGLDGQRRYLNSSLPQVGTEQILVVSPNGTQTIQTQAWFQWWARDEVKMNKSVLPDVPVSAGDQVIAFLWVIGKGEVEVFFHNLTSGLALRFFALAPLVNVPGGGTTVPVIAGATAEWVTERPTIPSSEDLYRFPDYGSVTFDQCVAGAAPAPGPAQVEQTLQGAFFLRMYEVLEDPMRTAFISMPSRVSDTSVKTIYGGF